MLRAPDKALRYVPGGLVGVPNAQTPPDGSGGVRVWALRDGSPSPVIIVPGLDDDSYTENFTGDLLADHIGTPKTSGKADNPTRP